MRLKLLYVFLTYFLFSSKYEGCEASFGGEKQISNLRTKLLKNYDKNAPPLQIQKNSTVVGFTFALNNQDLDDVSQTMSINAWLIVIWDDANLMWNKEKFGNLSRIHLSPKDVWTPDILLYNSKTTEKFVLPETIPLVAVDSGVVMWFPPFWGEVPCEMNLEKWPSDSHSCKFIFRASSPLVEMIDLQLLVDNKNGGVILDNYEDNSKWSLKNLSSKIEFINYGREQMVLSFTATVQRTRSKIVSYLSTSSFAVIVVLISSYGLPMEFQMIRVIFHLFSLLIFTLFCALLTFSIPSKQETPLIVSYYEKLSLLTLFSLILNTIMLNSFLLSKIFGFKLKDNFRKWKQISKGSSSSKLVPELYSEEVELSTLVSQPQDTEETEDNPEIRFFQRTFSVFWLLNVTLGVVFAISYMLVYFNMKTIF